MAELELLLIIMFWIMIISATMYVAWERGQSVGWAFASAFFLGPIGLWIFLAGNVDQAELDRRKRASGFVLCPYCKEYAWQTATICPHCRSDLSKKDETSADSTAAVSAR